MFNNFKNLFKKNATSFNKDLRFYKKISFKILGMHCPSCGMNIDNNLEGLKGVIEAKTNYAKSRTEVLYDPKAISPFELESAISKTGYQPSKID